MCSSTMAALQVEPDRDFGLMMSLRFDGLIWEFHNCDQGGFVRAVNPRK